MYMVLYLTMLLIAYYVICVMNAQNGWHLSNENVPQNNFYVGNYLQSI